MKRIACGLIVVLTLGSCSTIVSPSTYEVKGEFTNTVGLFPGSFVRELGIDIGSVTKVANVGDHVQVTMKIARSHPLRPDAEAVLVGDSLLGERYVQFTPAYTGGARLADGSDIPESRTVVPVETDEVLRSLNRVLGAIDPANVHDLVVNLATIVDGQGQGLNQLIGNASGTLGLLAAKSNDLGQLTDSLASLTGALRQRDDSLASLIRDYDTVSQVLADNRQLVDSTVTNLNAATTQAAALLATNLDPLQQDVAVVTTAGQTLDRNVDSVDRLLTNTPRLFAAAQRAYDPVHNWLPLNNEVSGEVTSAVLAARVRDSLASVCRRLALKNPAQAPALAACGNPNSGFFDPILNLIPSILAQGASQKPGTSSPAGKPAVRAAAAAPAVPTAAGLFAQGLAAIPGAGLAPLASLASTGSGGRAGPLSVPSLNADPALGPMPLLNSAPPAHHHKGLFGAVCSWIGGLL